MNFLDSYSAHFFYIVGLSQSKIGHQNEHFFRYGENLQMQNQNNEKSYKCEQCGFASVQAGKLNRHKNIHSGEKPYQCHQCNFAAVRSDGLKRHLKFHSGEKSYECNQCQYASVQASDLRRHMKSHSGEKTQMQSMRLCIC